MTSSRGSAILDQLREHGADFAVVGEHIADGPLRTIMLALFGYAAEDERRRIIERFTRGKLRAATDGRMPQGTGVGTYGYILVPGTGKRAINEVQAEVVRTIFNHFLATHSANGVAARLNRDGVPAFKGGRWHPRTVANVLQNVAYTGVTYYGRTQRTKARSARTGKLTRQGEYYTGVGYANVGDVAREIVDAHIDLCLEAGIELEGINAEVAKGQWEFQIFGKGSKRAADELWIARYLLLRLCERYRVDINFHPKPLGMENDWNGSGLHTNFSTEHLREVGGEEYFEALMSAFDESRTSTSPCTARQPHAPDRPARDAVDRHVRLRRREPRCVDPHPAQLRPGRLPRLPRGSPAERARRPLPDRRPDPADDRDGADAAGRGGGLTACAY